MALIEGHAEHVMDAAGAPLPRARRAARLARRRRARAPAAVALLGRLLGLELKLRQYELRQGFCDAVVARGRDRRAQPRLVRAGELLPTRAELETRRLAGAPAASHAAGLTARRVPVAVLVTITPGPRRG